MYFWWRLPIAVVIASILTSMAYVAGVGSDQIGSWSSAGLVVLALAPLFGLAFVVFVVPATIALRFLKVGAVLSAIIIVALCIGIDVYLYVVHYRMPIGESIGRYLYGAAGIGLVGGLGYVAIQYLTVPWRRMR
jgi:hypothetical protein